MAPAQTPAFALRARVSQPHGPMTVARPQRSFRKTGWPFLVHAAILLLVAFALRKAQFGNPVVGDDEQFYLLVGDRLLHGMLPYVDIWDCKPPGLFLLYAGIRLLGGSGIVQYQIVATIFAAATAIMIARVGQRIGGGFGALCGGLVYLLWINWFGGDGGQTPVFYNAFVTGAAMVVLSALDTSASRGRLRRLGCAAMALIGIGLQIKYACVFEGVFFGLVLLHAGFSRGATPAQLAADGALWIACALAPTAAAWAFYGLLGHGEAFAYANFVAEFRQTGLPAGERLAALWRIFANTLVLTIPAVAAARLWRPATAEAMRTRLFAWGWLGAAWFGLLAYGAYFENYALPLLVPTSLVLVPALSLPAWGPILAAVALAFGYVGSSTSIHRHVRAREGREAIDRVVSLIKSNLGRGCLYIYSGPSIPYLLTNACFVSPYVFPGHLRNSKMANALPVGSTGELREVLAGEPRVIVREQSGDGRDALPDAIVGVVLARSYRLVGSVKFGHDHILVYKVDHHAPAERHLGR